MGKSELAAAVALLLTCGDGEERAEVYGCAADRQQATIVFDVASTEKIDGAVATIMGLDRAIRCGNNTGASVYDDRGILFI